MFLEIIILTKNIGKLAKLRKFLKNYFFFVFKCEVIVTLIAKLGPRHTSSINWTVNFSFNPLNYSVGLKLYCKKANF